MRAQRIVRGSLLLPDPSHAAVPTLSVGPNQFLAQLDYLENVLRSMPPAIGCPRGSAAIDDASSHVHHVCLELGLLVLGGLPRLYSYLGLSFDSMTVQRDAPTPAALPDTRMEE